MAITQDLADQLIAMGKIPEDPSAAYLFPQQGDKLVIPLVSDDHREEFKLDVNRSGRIHVQLRVTHQLRARQVVQLVRLDVGGPDHANPDGEVVPCPHLHVYREGFGDKWALPVPPEFSDLTDIAAIFNDFAIYCKVLRMPSVNFPLI
jgi:MoaA/NifB/PqqE/SkfB family radical SAM enzyme